jgi:DNA-binding response OmpR family regulator
MHLSARDRQLVYFLQHTGRVITPQELEEALWPGEYVEDPERVRSPIKGLRKACWIQFSLISSPSPPSFFPSQRPFFRVCWV